MTSQAELKQFASLRMPKFRQKYGQFTVEGRKAVHEVFHSRLKVVKILATKWYIDRYNPEYDCDIISDPDNLKLSQYDTPPGIIAVVEIPKDPQWDQNQTLTLALDGISDPGNMGTIIRIADWYGIKQILMSNDCVDVYNNKCLAATMGSFTRVDCIYTDLLETIQGKNVFGAFLGGTSIYELKLTEPTVLLIGSESHGIREHLNNVVTNKITIPRIGEAESLNAGVATAIMLDRLCVPS
jgi:TrmH family RNA methyltransferase